MGGFAEQARGLLGRSADFHLRFEQREIVANANALSDGEGMIRVRMPCCLLFGFPTVRIELQGIIPEIRMQRV